MLGKFKRKTVMIFMFKQILMFNTFFEDVVS